jgi:hypothetical protein
VRLPVQWLIQGTAGLLQNICHTIQTYTGPTLVHQRLSSWWLQLQFFCCALGTFCRCILCVRETTVAILIKLSRRQNTYVHVHSACIYIHVNIFWSCIQHWHRSQTFQANPANLFLNQMILEMAQKLCVYSNPILTPSWPTPACHSLPVAPLLANKITEFGSLYVYIFLDLQPRHMHDPLVSPVDSVPVSDMRSGPRLAGPSRALETLASRKASATPSHPWAPKHGNPMSSGNDLVTSSDLPIVAIAMMVIHL